MVNTSYKETQHKASILRFFWFTIQGFSRPFSQIPGSVDWSLTYFDHWH